MESADSFGRQNPDRPRVDRFRWVRLLRQCLILYLRAHSANIANLETDGILLQVPPFPSLPTCVEAAPEFALSEGVCGRLRRRCTDIQAATSDAVSWVFIDGSADGLHGRCEAGISSSAVLL